MDDAANAARTVDNDLVTGAEEEIFEMNNGCICCTVRGDLIRILSNLMKRRVGLVAGQYRSGGDCQG